MQGDHIYLGTSDASLNKELTSKANWQFLHQLCLWPFVQDSLQEIPYFRVGSTDIGSFIPRPHLASVAFSTEKQGRTIFSHVCDVRIKRIGFNCVWVDLAQNSEKSQNTT